MIDKMLLKNIMVASLITGGICGIIPLIPSFIWIAALLLMFAVAPVVVIYLNGINLSDITDTEKTVTISAISGAFAVFGFCVIYMPLGLILNLIFKIEAFLWIKVIFVNFGFIIPMILFTALLSALLNAFSGFLTVYFYNVLSGNKRG